MKRRDFLRTAGVASAALAFPTAGRLFADDAAPAISNDWRTFEIIARVEVLNPSGETRVWLPAALSMDTPYQRTSSNKFEAQGGKPHLVRVSKDDAKSGDKKGTATSCPAAKRTGLRGPM